MKTLTIYDKPMCCSTGVCGPSVDPVLARFADDLRWLAARGVRVERHNPSQDPSPFLLSGLVREAMKSLGEQALPLVVVDGVECSRQRYPQRDELAAWTGADGEVMPSRSGGGGCGDDSGCC